MTLDALVEPLDELAKASRETERMKIIIPLENRLERGMMRAFREQERRFLRGFKRLKPLWPEPPQLREAITPREWQPIFQAAANVTARFFSRPLSAVLSLAMRSGGDQAIADVGLDVSFDVDHPDAVAYLETVPLKIAGINATTENEIRRILINGVEQGWSYDRTAQVLQQKFESFRKPVRQQHIRSRAHLIAVTETGDAYAQGELIVGRQLRDAGLRMEKRWLTAGDERVCPICVPNEAAGWIAIDDTFPSGHEAPTAHPACRCDIEQRPVIP